MITFSFFNKTAFFFVLAFVFFLPYDSQLNNYALGGFLIFTLADKQFIQNYRLSNFIRIDKILLFFILSLYLLLVISLLHGGIEKGSVQLLHKLSLFLIPIFVLGIRYEAKKWHWILFVFVLGVFINSLAVIYLSLKELGEFSYAGIMQKHVIDGDPNVNFFKIIFQRRSFLSYTYLSKFIHPSYLALYITFSIATIYFFLRNKLFHIIIRIFFILSLPFFFLFLVLLTARASFIAVFFLLVSIIVLEVFRYKKKFLSSIFIFLFLSGLFFLSKNDRIQHNLKEVVGIAEDGLDTEKNYDARIYIWYGAINVIEDNFWTGVGVANSEVALDEFFKKMEYQIGVDFDFNSHNQFLDIWVESGVFGFLLAIGIFVVALVISIKKRNFLLFAFIGIMFINLLFESMLNRFSGVAFFALFLSILAFHADKIKPIRKDVHS